MTGGKGSDTLPRICIATGTRAEWGLLRPIAAALRDSGMADVQILATNMHLSERYGHTVDEIIADGFDVSARVAMDVDDDSPCGRAHAMADCLRGTADCLERMAPDALVILGDRYEMLAIASAAAMLRVPIIHSSGGEISEGAIDDSIRHAITKLSALHLTSTEAYRNRVIAMGEQPDRVINTGSIGVWNVLHGPMLTRDELADSLSLPRGCDFIVSTYHPATLDDTDPVETCRNMLSALDATGLHLVITYPNNDAGGRAIISTLEEFAAARPEKVRLVKSLGAARYLPAITYAKAVVGNSSSGIIEVPSAGTPTVDIGIRQRGRIAAPSVIHCGTTKDEIARAVSEALSAPMQQLADKRINPYHRHDTLAMTVKSVLDFVGRLPMAPKKFYDIKPC